MERLTIYQHLVNKLVILHSLYMLKRNYIGIDLFSGAGGMSIGAIAAGVDIKVAIEIDKFAAVTYQANHPKTKLFNEDIRKVKINGFCKPGKNDVKILFGGPHVRAFLLQTRRLETRKTRVTGCLKNI